jgi:hypothetical protein
MTAPAQRLNLVFHGMFAFVFWRDRLEVLAPQEDDHVYKAGAWGRERRLREGHTYALRGVQPGASPPPIDASGNLIVSRFTTIERDPDVLCCSIQLALPDSMSGLRRVKLHPTQRLFAGAAIGDATPTSVPLIQVLTFNVEDFSGVSLDPLTTWTPKPGRLGSVNLHIWAESDSFFTEEEKDHPIRGFEQLIRLFPGLDLQLLYSTGVPMDPAVDVPGLEVWEQATLRERSKLLFGVPEDPDERGAEVTNCLSLIVDNSDQ